MLLSEIDETSRSDHYHLTAQDECLYLYEYTSDRDYSFSRANSIISNLKKKPSDKNKPGYAYKGETIIKVSKLLRGVLKKEWLNDATLIPVPGSKCVNHPDYDDRMEKICRGIRNDLDVRNLVTQSESTTASHEAGPRVTLNELLDLYEIDKNLTNPAPTDIAVVDDVLTAGTHFRAMKTILNQRFPDVPIVGIFIARRIFPDSSDP